MILKIGDIVEFIDEKLEVEVVQLISPSKVKVKDDFDLEYEVDIHKLLKKEGKNTFFKLTETPTFKKEKPNDNQRFNQYIDTYKIIKKAEAEIDLHLHEILPENFKFDKNKALSLQISLFEYAVERAQKGRIRSLNIIHGFGEGVLRNEIRIRLKDMGLEFMDSAYGTYGQGATKIFIH